MGQPKSHVHFADSLEITDLGLLLVQNAVNVVISEKLIPSSLMSSLLRILSLSLNPFGAQSENLRAKLLIWLKPPVKVAVNFNC